MRPTATPEGITAGRSDQLLPQPDFLHQGCEAGEHGSEQLRAGERTIQTLDAIEAVPTSVAPGTNERSRPVETVYIESIEISQ